MQQGSEPSMTNFSWHELNKVDVWDEDGQGLAGTTNPSDPHKSGCKKFSHLQYHENRKHHFASGVYSSNPLDLTPQDLLPEGK